MILPPFFGYPIPSTDREVYRLKLSLLANDILSYKIPTKTAMVGLIGQDVFTYEQVYPETKITFLAQDVFSFPTAKPVLHYGYAGVDVLTYYPPPTVPEAPFNISGVAGDSSVTLYWQSGYSNRANTLDYVIQYSTGLFDVWDTYNDGVSINTNSFISGLMNNEIYQFRIAAVNSVGTGAYSAYIQLSPESEPVNYCDLRLYIPFNNNYFDKSCNDTTIQAFSTTENSISLSYNTYKYGGYSLYLDGTKYGEDNNFENPPEYPHLMVGYSQDLDWSPSGDFTIETFIYPLNGYNSGTIFSIKNKIISILNNSSIQLYKLNNSIYFDFITDYTNNITNQSIYNSSQMVANNLSLSNKWTHVAVSRHSGTMRLFIDGIQIQTINDNHIPKLNNHNFFIGAKVQNNSSVAGSSIDGFGGYIDQFIYTNMAKYKSSFVPTEYVTPYDCDCGNPYPYPYDPYGGYSQSLSKRDVHISW